MATDIPAKQETSNPCCRAWEDKYKLYRSKVRQALKDIEQKSIKIEAANLSLKKACEEEKARADTEKRGREEALAARVSLESQISALKSEITRLQQKGGSSAENIEDAKLSGIRVIEKEKEIKQLNEKLEKEKVRADSEKRSAEAEKKNAAEAWKCVEAEKAKADEERKRANIEGKKAEEYRLQLESLSKEADDAKSKLGREEALAARVSLENQISALKSEITRLQQKGGSNAKNIEDVKLSGIRVIEKEKEIKQLNEKLEKEKIRADSEKRSAEAEKKNAAEAWKCVEAEKAKADEEKKRANIEGKKAEEYRLQLESLTKEADYAKSKLVSESSKLGEVSKKLDAEKQKMSKEKKRANVEGRKAEEYRLQLEALRKEADDAKSLLVSEASKLEALRTKLEAEKLMVSKERKCATIEGKKAEEYKLQLEVLQIEVGDTKSKLVCEASKSEALSGKLDAEKLMVSKERQCADLAIAKVEEQRKLAEANRKQAEEAKRIAQILSQQLEETGQRIAGLQKEINDFHSYRKPFEASAIQVDKYLNRESGEVKLLKKQLKFEKSLVKHAKEVAKLQKDRNSILREELCRLKLDFVQFFHRLDTVDKIFSPNSEGTDNLGNMKVRNSSDTQIVKLKESPYNVEPVQMYLQSKIELPSPRFTDVAASSPLRKTLHGMCSESMSGIDSKDSKLESLLGGSSRKMLQSSAINSSSASFSDRQLMGSQERGAFSFTTSSKLMNIQAENSSLSGEVNRVRCDEGPAMDAENSFRSTLKIGFSGKDNRPSRKRKRILNEIESIELLHSKDRKLHLQMEEKLSNLHNILNKQQDKSVEEANYTVANLQEAFKHERFPKKKRASREENIGILHLCDGAEMKKAEKLLAKVDENALGPAIDLTGTAHALTGGITATAIDHHEALMNIEEVANGDYMKLLDLDNPADEECYRAAMEIPLSPILPEIEFRNVETLDISVFDPLADERFYGVLSNEKENMVPSCSYDVMNTEIISNELNNTRDFRNSLLYQSESPIDSFCVQASNGSISRSDMQAGISSDSQAVDELVISNDCRSRDEGAKSFFARELGHDYVNIPEHCVVVNDIKDANSISRIIHATETCMNRCSLVGQTEWMLHKILLALQMEDHLLSKEKACVFLSLSLFNFCVAVREKSRNSLSSDIIVFVDSFACHVNALMSDVEARSVFDELYLDVLFNLIEDFIMDGKILTRTDVSFGALGGSNPTINLLMDGENTNWSTEAPSTTQLVAGSIILASIAVATDHIGFICEASYNIFRMRIYDPSLVLMVLHSFAYLGGEKIFTLKTYNLAMTVLKSVVMFLERGSLSVCANSSTSLSDEIKATFHPCAECPFSKDAVSVDIAMSLLLEKLHSFSESGTVNALLHKEHVEKSFQDHCGASDTLNKCKMSALQSKSVVDATLWQVTDVLSWVELISCMMSWDWTCATVVPELLRMLESPIAESFTIAIITLVNQLGRIGVKACGIDDKNVENLRSTLSSFLWRESTTRAGLPLQIATVIALLELLSVNFGQVIDCNLLCPSMATQSAATDSIRKWFSSLSKEHQALFGLFQSSDPFSFRA